jgi:hypothetical protein
MIAVLDIILLRFIETNIFDCAARRLTDLPLASILSPIAALSSDVGAT